MLTRRQLLIAGCASASLALWPRFAKAASALDPRLLVVLLRGGLDGLHALQPYADPAYARLRGALAAAGPQGEPHRLDGLFALHPALEFTAGLYAKGRLLPVIAIAPPYRERSHFDAQNCLENGTDRPGGSGTGWLNRCVAALPDGEGLALATVMPLILRGGGPARTWSPPLPEAVDPVLMERLRPLYAADPRLAEAFAEAAQGSLDAGAGMSAEDGRLGRRRRGGAMVEMATAAARFLSVADGPQVGFLEDSGWDTHGNQIGTLNRKLGELDAALEAFHDAAQAIWPRTVVMVLTEFGRTVAVNGTAGTDHGTGGLALLAGGAVRGGRIGGDWPGLGASDLHEGRDLRATADLRSLCKGVLAAHLQLPEAALDTRVFPDSATAPAMERVVG